MKTWKMTWCVVCALALVACEGDKNKSDEEATAQQAAEGDGEAEKEGGAKEDDAAEAGGDGEAKEGGEDAPDEGEDAQAAGGGEADGEAPPEMEMEEDPNARDDLERVEMKDDEAPGQFADSFQLKGDVVDVLGWRDKNGLNAMVISIEDQKAKGDKKTKLMRAIHAYQEGDASWTAMREFKERVADCPFDIILEPITGEWSLSDADEDGIAEVTIAYHAGCTSDVSPNTHKVLMSEGGDKYALRGSTRLDMGGKKMGGEYKVDPSFKSGPASFLTHAKKAWEASVDEK